MNTLPRLSDIQDLAGKKVFLRADLNVPLNSEGVVEDDFRIRKTLPTLNYLREHGARILMFSHLGREGDSLEAVKDFLGKEIPLSFVTEYFSDNTQEQIDSMQNGDVILFENLRLHSEEEAGDADFAQRLASLADIYVNDAFASSHRSHASIVGVPHHIPAYAGLQLAEEIDNLSKAFDPDHPFLFILGGAKFETKIPLIKKFLATADDIFLGGALLNAVLKARGLEVGESLVPEEDYDYSDITTSDRIMETYDVVVREGEEDKNVSVQDVTKNASIFDVGEKTLSVLIEKIQHAKFIVWNGPMGYYEGGYSKPTEAIAEAIAHSSAYSVIGGGDTLAVVRKQGTEKDFTFVSTGGGAMLEFLAEETLVGIEALKQ